MTRIANPDLPAVGDGTCCEGAAMFGPGHCTCWGPVYDLEQAEPHSAAVQLLAAGIEPVTRTRMCEDCAYRPGSPEKLGDPQHAGDAEHLDDLAANGQRFWCHQGMRRPQLWRHPDGVEIPGHAADYAPPIVGGVPYRADGTPGELCAGWDARRRAITAGAR